mmetsp:Transcript_97670/g.232498  ORF Transcript_97670/g.232498 Transcript_97670/m.232498 type:complete len:84 (-) Transcript_97670:326-577(-)
MEAPALHPDSEKARFTGHTVGRSLQLIAGFNRTPLGRWPDTRTQCWGHAGLLGFRCSVGFDDGFRSISRVEETVDFFSRFGAR